MLSESYHSPRCGLAGDNAPGEVSVHIRPEASALIHPWELVDEARLAGQVPGDSNKT